MPAEASEAQICEKHLIDSNPLLISFCLHVTAIDAGVTVT